MQFTSQRNVREKVKKLNNWQIQFLIGIVALLSTGSVHFANNRVLKEQNSASLRAGISVITADDVSYIRPVENWLESGIWRTNDIGDRAYVQRSPGYGLLYLAFRSWNQQDVALLLLILCQIVVFSLSASLIPSIAVQLGMSRLLSILTAFIVAMMPMFSGFLSYSLTEGIVPSLVLILFYFLLRNRSKGFVLAGSILGILLLIRPSMVVLFFAFIPFLNRKNWKSQAMGFFIAILPLGIWQFTSYQTIGRIPGLHPIYHTDSNTLYRPLHSEIWNFHKMTGQTGKDFHNSMNALWEVTGNDTDPDDAVFEVMQNLDPRVYRVTSRDSLYHLYSRYISVLGEVRMYSNSQEPMPGELPEEIELRKSYRDLKKSFISEFPLYSLVVVPAQVYGRMAFHSNLSLYLFQKPLRGNPIIELLRFLSFLLHSAILVLIPVFLIYYRSHRNGLSLALPFFLYLVYLAFIQRGVEERYTLPFLIPGFLLLIKFTSDIFRMNQKLNLYNKPVQD